MPQTAAAGPTPPLPDRGHVWVDDAEPALLRMRGEVDVAVVEDLRDRLGAQSARGTDLAAVLPRVRVVDMTEVTFADSSAVGLLAGLVMALQSTGDTLAVRGIGPAVETLLEVTGLLPHLVVEG
ncbi:STAS domain-containing protein [Cellulomonas sp. ACRRI]|uniref:STAS domain-containing protein n=1 Tax=Cellulomonas sp. ACRRI TaxID=2918188 RepID=UPI001EF2FE10|nr:STAS domain-containing protein [Cellulomonas sp. ACRRI]MCG7287114.1 STAS domain-containing protein [Cellulomonas sp. ACRRI]